MADDSSLVKLVGVKLSLRTTTARLTTAKLFVAAAETDPNTIVAMVPTLAGRLADVSTVWCAVLIRPKFLDGQKIEMTILF